MFLDKKIVHIVARGMNGEIGGDNDLLWKIPEDLRFFKEITIGHSLLMGRKTADSLPAQLKRRLSTVVSSNDWSGIVPRETVLHAALLRAKVNSDLLNTDVIYVIGGSHIYNQTMDIVDEVMMTNVFESYPYADTFYQLPPFIKKGVISPKTKSINGGVEYEIVKYEKT